ncbi:MAG: VOC family protein [Burkholderiales bacterium]|nr:VOC family protein [Burkholderiales bacterium]
MNPVVHFEMPYDDNQRAATFYATAFGWQMQAFGAEMNHYVVATTTPSNPDDGRPSTPGAINGGLFPRKPDWPGQHPSVVVAVDNIGDAIARVRDAGGEVYGEPMMIPGVGHYVAFSDTEGNRLSMLQPQTVACTA